MAKSKTIKDLKKIIIDDIAYNQNIVNHFKNNNNPQVKEIYFKTTARIEAMEAVLQYCKTGEKFFFDKDV
jgi:polysaccharide deacetylase 2 family uncharacterized protein YibQ